MAVTDVPTAIPVMRHRSGTQDTRDVWRIAWIVAPASAPRAIRKKDNAK